MNTAPRGSATARIIARRTAWMIRSASRGAATVAAWTYAAEAVRSQSSCPVKAGSGGGSVTPAEISVRWVVSTVSCSRVRTSGGRSASSLIASYVSRTRASARSAVTCAVSAGGQATARTTAARTASTPHRTKARIILNLHNLHDLHNLHNPHHSTHSPMGELVFPRDTTCWDCVGWLDRFD